MTPPHVLRVCARPARQIRAGEEARKREEEARREADRHHKYAAALETEEMRKSSVKSRAEAKERMLAELYAQRRKEHDLKKVEQEFQLKLRLDKVGVAWAWGAWVRVTGCGTAAWCSVRYMGVGAWATA